MGLITKGMGAVLKHIKKGGKAIGKKVPKRIKENLPFAGAVGAVEAGRHGYNIIKGKKDVHEGTITGIIKIIKKAKKK